MSPSPLSVVKRHWPTHRPALVANGILLIGVAVAGLFGVTPSPPVLMALAGAATMLGLASRQDLAPEPARSAPPAVARGAQVSALDGTPLAADPSDERFHDALQVIAGSGFKVHFPVPLDTDHEAPPGVKFTLPQAIAFMRAQGGVVTDLSHRLIGAQHTLPNHEEHVARRRASLRVVTDAGQG